MDTVNVWKKCSTCKRPIGFGQRYYECNVSTCNSRPNFFVFCQVPCWDAHLPTMRHKSAWAVEKHSPKSHSTTEEPPVRKIIPAASSSPNTNSAKEILVVASKLKAYIRTKSGMNTSGDVMDVLSDQLRKAADDAIENAKRAQRKTVMGRDF